MELLSALGMAIGLALDTAAVTASRALAGRRSLALPWLFGMFHGVMAAIGWAVGRQATTLVRDWDHWVAAALLAIVGGRMLVAPASKRGDAAPADSPWEILVLAIATSIDALAAGLAIEALGVAPAVAIGLIAGVCVALSTAAIPFGGWIGRRVGRHMDRVGGALLLLIAVRIVVTHMT